MTELEKLKEKHIDMVRKAKEAWDEVEATIVLSSPVKVGDVVAVEYGTYKIVGIRAVDWSDQPRYTVRKKTKKGWHAVVATVPGLSSDINRGRYKLVVEG